MFGAVAYNITQVSLRQAITPERLQGRMNAAMRWIVWGTIPLGTLTGGAIATGTNLKTALWVGAIGDARSHLVPLLLSSVRTISEMPEPGRGAHSGAGRARRRARRGRAAAGTLLRGCVGRAAHSGRTATS